MKWSFGFYITILVVFSLFIGIQPIVAEVTLQIDQAQTLTNRKSIMGYCGGHPWQSFVPSKPNLARIDIFLGSKYNPNTADLTMHIRTSPTGVDLTSVTVPESELNAAVVYPEYNPEGWAAFDFPDINVIPGDTYYIVMDNQGQDSGWGWFQHDLFDAYTLGEGCTCDRCDWTFITYCYAIKEVMIDIKPGSDPNCFNNDGHGVIPVAILGSDDFEVTDIDIDNETVSLEGMAVKMAGKSNKLLARIEDVNEDGFDDLMLQIEDVDGSFEPGDTEAVLTGNLVDGTPFQGTDTICIVGPTSEAPRLNSRPKLTTTWASIKKQ